MNAPAGNLIGMETRTLWHAWRERRESAAFEALVRPELAYARDLARRLGARHDEADDIVQESLVQLAREESDAPVRYGLRAWIGRRVVLKVKMRARSSGRRRRHERAAPGPRAGGRDTLEARDEVEHALARLKATERRVVVLRFLYDLDYGEIAYVMRASEGACRLRVHKALKRLRTLLGARTPAALIAALGIQAPADAALAKGALAATAAGVAKKGRAALVVTKTHAAVAATALSVAVATAVLRNEPASPPAPAPPPPAEVAAEPAPPPAPPPAPAPAPAPGGLDLLADHLARRVDLTDRFWDFDAAAAPVRAPQGPVARFEAGDREIVTLPPRGVAVFGRGTFRVRTWAVRGPLALKGAGREGTTLLLDAPIHVRADATLAHLRVSDLALDGGVAGHTALTVRGGAAAVFERVRFHRWNPDAGHGAPVGVSGRAYLAFRDCVFLGGDRRPAGGHALSLRRTGVALFDRCRFVDLEAMAVLDGRGVRGFVHARRCVLVNTRVTDRPATVPVDVRATTEIAVTRVTLGDLLRVLFRFSPGARDRITGVQALAWEGRDRALFVVHLLDLGGDRRTVVLDGDAKVTSSAGLVLPRLPGRDRSFGGRALVDVVADVRGALEARRPASGLVDWALNGPANQPEPCVTVQDLFGNVVLHVTSDSGRIQDRTRAKRRPN